MDKRLVTSFGAKASSGFDSHHLDLILVVQMLLLNRLKATSVCTVHVGEGVPPPMEILYLNHPIQNQTIQECRKEKFIEIDI